MKYNKPINTLTERLAELRLIPVVAIPDSSQAIPLADALNNASLPCAEITFRTEAAEESIHLITSQFPKMLIGAGTIVNTAQAERAVKAGAKYLVSPGFSASVVEWCLAHEIAIFPGVATSTEIITALDYGLNVLKFFPSENLGGVAMLKALHGPFKEIKFIPTGGISPENLSSYLALPNILALGGTWFVKENLIRERRFSEIETLTREAWRLTHP